LVEIVGFGVAKALRFGVAAIEAIR
jgi:hypothetical protein